MPEPFSSADYTNEEVFQEILDGPPPQKHSRQWALFKGWKGLRKNEQDVHSGESSPPTPWDTVHAANHFQPRSEIPEQTAVSSETASVTSKPVLSLPRAFTFQRRESERRDKLELPPGPIAGRTASLDRRRNGNTAHVERCMSPVPLPSVSAPDLIDQASNPFVIEYDAGGKGTSGSSRDTPERRSVAANTGSDKNTQCIADEEDEVIDRAALEEEYDCRWILNLGMHFRDKSKREKFFVTYAETPTKWRRLTISLDYRNAPLGSLEADLSTLHYQRDKSFRIYEAVRESLPEIQYYDTVTNLKLETSPEDDQLHVHVREDANEIIEYPLTSLFASDDDRGRSRVLLYRESELEFISHLSGFVYKVRAGDEIFIKKEIPGPDTIDEFFYEVNALEAVLSSSHVIRLRGLVTNDAGTAVKGLLITHAPHGALVDILYDLRGSGQLPWHRREKWAKQIVAGLADIHEAGFVQGDFTLSNIVIDEQDNAQIIDINRRGCPVGWEPPELGRLIERGQKISMCIGVKTDLFQLGMVLWALAEENDEPELAERPLSPLFSAPAWYREIVETCLSSRPELRVNAQTLLRDFPYTAGIACSPSRLLVDFAEDLRGSANSLSTSHRSDRVYMDPAMAVTIDDVNARHRRHNANAGQLDNAEALRAASNGASSAYRGESTGSWVLAHADRSLVSSRRGRDSPYAHPQSSSSATSLSRSPPSRGRPRRGSDASPAADLRACDHEDSDYSPVLHINGHDNHAPEDSPEMRDWDFERAMQQHDQVEPSDRVPTHERSFGSNMSHADSGFDETIDFGNAVEYVPAEIYLPASTRGTHLPFRHRWNSDSAIGKGLGIGTDLQWLERSAPSIDHEERQITTTTDDATPGEQHGSRLQGEHEYDASEDTTTTMTT